MSARVDKVDSVPPLNTEPKPGDPQVAMAQENDALACFAWQAMLVDAHVAAALFRELCARAPNYADYWSALGVAAAKIGQRREAIVALEKAVTLKPKAIEAWCILGELCIDELDWKRAANALSQCISLDPNAKHPHGMRARALIKKSEKLLEKATG